jgi:acetamidase/formamidase
MHIRIQESPTVHRWNNALPAVQRVAPGDTVTVTMPDSSGGQVQPDWNAATFREKFDPLMVHALVGPIAVDGAEPGDVLELRIHEYRHFGWAWTALIPPLGLLPEHFPRHHLQIWKLEETRTRSVPGLTLELHPFAGIIGVQRAEAGEFRTRAPGPFGGNMDVRHLGAGATLLLPVFTKDAGLCVGDCHAAQGDGEVCINGMEAAMEMTFTVLLRKQQPLAGPQLIATSPLLPPRYASSPFTVFIESDEAPREAAKRAVLRAIEYITGRIGCTREVAYTVCSVVLDLRISQLVNVPTTTVSAYLPEAIFD